MSALTTLAGAKIDRVVIAYYGPDRSFVGADVLLEGGEQQYFSVEDLAHPDGMLGIMAALNDAAKISPDTYGEDGE